MMENNIFIFSLINKLIYLLAIVGGNSDSEAWGKGGVCMCGVIGFTWWSDRILCVCDEAMSLEAMQHSSLSCSINNHQFDSSWVHAYACIFHDSIAQSRNNVKVKIFAINIFINWKAPVSSESTIRTSRGIQFQDENHFLLCSVETLAEWKIQTN